jgi:hypothetical protein
MANLILENLDNPHALEHDYRQDSIRFTRELKEAMLVQSDSAVLAVWHERLHYVPASKHDTSTTKRDWLVVLLLAILTGVITRILFEFITNKQVDAVNIAFGVMSAMVVYFVYKNASSKKTIVLLATIIILSILGINNLPEGHANADLLAYLHLPILLWGALGLAYVGNQVRDLDVRVRFIQWMREFGVLYVGMAAGGIVLTALTLALFRLIGMNIEQFYAHNVVVFGASSLAIVAAFLTHSGRVQAAKWLASYLAKLFSPLVLVTLLIYSGAVIWLGKNPFIDREFLMSFNGVLLAVLLLAIVSVLDKVAGERRTFFDWINAALITLALLLDTIALAAILFRLSEFGVSPNRIAVLAINLLVWGNLVWMLVAYMRYLRNQVDALLIQHVVALYLPIYGAWAAFVTFAFPYLFNN